jgi:hypothetical protein
MPRGTSAEDVKKSGEKQAVKGFSSSAKTII